jgi:hypothetical protein
MSQYFQRLIHFATVLIFALALVQPTLAQQTPATIRLLPEDQQRGHNGHQHNFYFLPPGVTGENYESAGFFGQRLRPYLAGNPEALSNLNAYRRQKTLFLLDRLVSVGALGLYGQQVFANGEAQYFNNTQKVAGGIFVTSLLATLLINNNTNLYLQRSVEAYNVGRARSSVWPRLRPSAVGLSSSSTGQPQLALRWDVR